MARIHSSRAARAVSATMTSAAMVLAAALAPAASQAAGPTPEPLIEDVVDSVTVVSSDPSVSWGLGSVTYTIIHDEGGFDHDTVDAVVPSAQPRSFELIDLGSGRIRLKEPTSGRCIAAQGLLRLKPCDNTVAFTWVVQPEAGSTGFRIRPFEGSTCVSSRPLQTFYAAGSSTYEDGIAGFPCEKGAQDQIWSIVGASGADLRPRLMSLASKAAMSLCGSDFIRTCDYAIRATSTPFLGEPRTAETLIAINKDLPTTDGVYYNGTTDPMSVVFQWSTNMSTSYSVADSHTVSTGFPAGGILTSLSYAYNHTVNTTTVKGLIQGLTANITVKPDESAWVAHEQLLQRTSGTFTFVDAIGNTWQSEETVDAPIEPTGGRKSRTTFCTSDSPTPACVSTRPSW